MSDDDDLTINLSGYWARHSLRHVTRSRAATVASLHEINPKAVLSSAPSLFHSATTYYFFWRPGLCCLTLGMFVWIHSEDVADELPVPAWFAKGKDIKKIINASVFKLVLCSLLCNISC